MKNNNSENSLIIKFLIFVIITLLIEFFLEKKLGVDEHSNTEEEYHREMMRGY